MYEKYRAHLKKLANGRPIIGVSWKGGYWQIQRKSKELELENWEPIFQRNALYVNLQYGTIANEINYIKRFFVISLTSNTVSICFQPSTNDSNFS